MALPPSTAFQRKLTYQMLEHKFSSDVYLQSKTGENRERYILVTKVKSEEEMRKYEEARLAEEMAEIDNAVGITKVIKHLSQSGKLVVGHNMHLDIIHTIHQFLYPIPEKYEEFKLLCQSVFPRIIDTKLMANTRPFKDSIEGSSLSQLLEITQRDPFRKPEVDLAEEMDNRYKDNELLHEAGFDAYITGKCFISLANYLGQCHKPPLERVSSDSPLFEPFVNKIYMMRSPDIPYMNIAGQDLNPPRNHVFHLSFPPDWKYENIADLFSVFGSCHIDWIDDVSAFVVLMNPSDTETVLKTLCKKGSVYELMSFNTYKELLKKSVAGRDSGSSSNIGNHTNHPAALSENTTHTVAIESKRKKRSLSPPSSKEKVKKVKTLNVDAPAFESRITPTSTPEKDEEMNWNENKNDESRQSNDGSPTEDKMFAEPDDW